MAYVMLLAHLLGDYVFQWGFIARWKTRSLVGVLAHGSIVTLTALACAGLTAPSWWPYAALIGLIHTAIDLVRARFLHTTNPTWELLWYLLDQLSHLAVIVLVVAWGGDPLLVEPGRAAGLLADRRVLTYATGYLFLTRPAWVLLRFLVRGLWGQEAAPCLGEGEMHGPMTERVLIATCMLSGQFYLVPLVLLPRRLVPIRVQGSGVGMLVRPSGHWAETLLSALLAVAIGLVLRAV